MLFSPVSITGTVIDEQGKRLGEAIVRLLSPSGTALAKVRADFRGQFCLNVAIEPGEYRLEVLLPGFLKLRQTVDIKPETKGRTLILMLRRDPKAMEPTVDKRESGISFLRDLPWGTHFCQFYQTEKDMLDILVPYFRAGLQNNEFCLWVTSDFLTKEEALEAMREGVPGFPDYFSGGQMEIIPHTDWYLKGGKFDLQKTMDRGMEKLDQAFSRGFSGMRGTGNSHWISNEKDWDDFARYEAAINKVICGTKLLALCTYPVKKCGPAEILDVTRNHEFCFGSQLGTRFRGMA